MAYATEAELQAYVGAAVTLPDDADRLLDRASELIDEHSHGRARWYWADPLPDPITAEQLALRNATCAQVEYWLEVGESYDKASSPGTSLSVGSLQISSLPPVLARRARRELNTVGFLYAGVAATDDTWGW